MSGVAVQDGAGTLGRKRGQPTVLRGQDTIGRHQGQRAAAGALTEQHRHRRHGKTDHLGDTPGDLPGQAALLGLLRQRRPGGVDDGHQGQVEVGGQAHAAARLS